MANAFDQFDQKPSQGNAFDQFDAVEPIASPSFTQRVTADFDKRNQQAQEIQAAADSGQQGAIQTGLQVVGLGAGKVNDVIGEAMTSVGQGISAITPDMIREPIAEGAQAAIESDIGQSALKGAGYVADKYGQLKQEYPNAMRSVEAAGNIVGAVPVSLGALKGGEKAITSAGEKVVDLATTKKRNLSTQIAKKEASGAAYKEALGSGVTFPNDFSQKMVKKVDDFIPLTEFEADLAEGSQSLKMANLLKKYEGKQLTIRDVDKLDKKLTDKAYSLWSTEPDEAKKISEIQDSLRESLAEYPVGGKLKEARDLWAQQAKMRDLLKIQEVAGNTKTPQTAIATAVNNIIKNDKRFAGYTDEEKELLRKAAKTGTLTDILSTTGSRLNAIAAGVVTGNPAVAGAVYGAGALARKGAEKIQGGKLNKVIEAVSERPIGQTEKAVEATGGKAPKYPAMEPMREKPRYTPPAREEIRRPNLKTTIKNNTERLPRSEYLNQPKAPSIEELKKLSRVESVPVSQVRSTQTELDMKKFSEGKYAEDMFKGYGDKPVAVKLNNGEYLVFDGHHRATKALREGTKNVDMHVIDAKDFDPVNAGRASSKPSMTDDELLRELTSPNLKTKIKKKD